MIAVMMVRDEEDVIGFTLAHLIRAGCRIVVADNRSTDNTRPILENYKLAFPDRVTIEDDPEVGYYQARKMTSLAERHAEEDEWVIPVDADEVWGNLDLLGELDAPIAGSFPYVQVPTPADDPADSNPFTRMAWRREKPEQMLKVAFRYTRGAQIAMGNHWVENVRGKTEIGVLDIRHFQYRTLAQVRRKVRNGDEAIKAIPGYHGLYSAHWKMLYEMSEHDLLSWWAGYQCGEMRLEKAEPCTLVHDPAPWRG